MKLGMKQEMKSSARRGPASKNVQSSARSRSSGMGQVADGAAVNKAVLKGRPSRGM